MIADTCVPNLIQGSHMSLINEYRATEEAIKELQERLKSPFRR